MKTWNWQGTEIEGVIFKAREWVFDGGLAGAIYFDVAPDTFIEGENNGASVVVVESDGGKLQRVRVATRCIAGSWCFMEDYVHRAAEWALTHLVRLPVRPDLPMSNRIIVWFSCGAASAVAAKLAVEKYGAACTVATCDTRSTEHSDNERFFRDVERWIGQPIVDLRATRYVSIDDVFQRAGYMSGQKGARCTVEMKKAPRVAFQRETDTHVFGYTSDEQRRATDFEKHNPELHVEWILIDENVSKVECLRRVEAAGIRLPEMYALGFEHNNCLACVKATSPDYWNLTRRLFPEAFARRATQSEALGVRLARVSVVVGGNLPRALPVYRKNKKSGERHLNGYRVFLSDLPPDAAGGGMEAIDCGPMCQTPEEGED